MSDSEARTSVNCVDFAAAVEAIGQLAAADWRVLDPAAVSGVWPRADAVRAEEPAAGGVEAISAALRECCDTCGTCGRPSFSGFAETPIRGLRSVDMVVCRDSPTGALAALKLLVDAAIPPDPEATYEGPGWEPEPDDEHVFNGFRWTAGGDTFFAEAQAYSAEGRWLGLFNLTRCRPSPDLEKWELDAGGLVAVRQPEVVERDSRGRRALRFSYLSDCLLRDHECTEKEAGALWPRVRTIAEANEATVVFFTAEDCRLSSATVFARQREDGGWDLPWEAECPSPPTSDCGHEADPRLELDSRTPLLGPT